MDIETIFSKALANFLFRELIEDLHVKYEISQQDIKKYNKMAVDRSALFIEILKDPDLLNAFINVYSLSTSEWDKPENNKNIKEIKNMLTGVSERLKNGESIF